jgi:hypothetical protein
MAIFSTNWITYVDAKRQCVIDSTSLGNFWEYVCPLTFGPVGTRKLHRIHDKKNVVYTNYLKLRSMYDKPLRIIES